MIIFFNGGDDNFTELQHRISVILRLVSLSLSPNVD